MTEHQVMEGVDPRGRFPPAFFGYDVTKIYKSHELAIITRIGDDQKRHW